MAPLSGDDLWYGPDDQWPRHPHPSLRDAIKVVRKARWHLRLTLGHGYGRAFCRRVEPGGAVCKVIIDTTPQHPEHRAKDLRRAVRDCPHQAAEQNTELNYASHLLDGANKLLDAAEFFLDAEDASVNAGDAWQRAQELLDAAEADAGEVERVIEIAQRFDEEARRLAHSGWTTGAEASGADGSAGSYVAGAEARTTEASSVMAGVANQDDPEMIDLEARLIATRGRIAQVKLRLGHGQP